MSTLPVAAHLRIVLMAHVGSLKSMAFDLPVPDLTKLIAAWEEFERGEQAPGKVLAKMKTAGLAQVLAQLAASGWTPAA